MTTVANDEAPRRLAAANPIFLLRVGDLPEQKCLVGGRAGDEGAVSVIYHDVMANTCR
jgi:hypothetical protein